MAGPNRDALQSYVHGVLNAPSGPPIEPPPPQHAPFSTFTMPHNPVPAATPRLRFYRINPLHHVPQAVETDVRLWACQDISSWPPPPQGMPPCCMLVITPLHPSGLSIEQRFPGIIFLMYDRGVNIPGGRMQVCFSRLDSEEIDRIVAKWENMQWIGAQTPPTTSLWQQEADAIGELEGHATKFVKGWRKGLDLGYRAEEGRIRGPARKALLDLQAFWLPHFQH